ncbi:hypothetical protein GCM10028806_33870 [Spirosoma terrae]|uniref:SGNH/GDSL hydrolase family protein n=1 Tax=Spirosoma terrae TaxID=1968276 RepID=A0A6L9LB70_9BACT|nr:SGNH/GDSL hydrolase family protein [Spirosoma terrae]NDU95698.1 SGNH/GDSL hydrolase family protein [Spirosoma terrae]
MFKYLSLCLLLILPLLSKGQSSGFPTTLLNTVRTVNYTEAERIRIEGLDLETAGLTYPTGFPASTTTTVANSSTLSFGTFGSPVTVGGFNPPITKKWYIDHYTLGTTIPVFARVSMGRPNSGDLQLYTGSNSYPANAVIYGGDGAISLRLQGKTDTTRRGALGFGVHGYTASADNDYEAPYHLYIYGDSNTEGTSVAGITSRWEVWTWRLKAYFKGKNQPIHLVDKSAAGQSSVLFDKIRGGGRLQGIKDPSLGLWALGTNDSDTAAYRVNLNRFINDWLKQYEAPLIILGPGPRSAGSSGETLAGYIRAIDAQVVAQFNQPSKVMYLNLGSAFSNVGDTYFTTTDSSTSGNRVHWNVAGQQAIAELLIGFLETRSFRLTGS